jgi:hypothetical protein
MSYEIINPVSHNIIGWFAKASARFGGFSIRQADEFDKETFGAQFRVCSPYKAEYRTVGKHTENNPLFWSRPARIYDNGIQVWESDEDDQNGRWIKWRGHLTIERSEVTQTSNTQKLQLIDGRRWSEDAIETIEEKW